jgi:FkbM family methyltransferase
MLLIQVPRFVPKALVIWYWIILSLSQGFLTNSHYIKSIKKFDSKISNDLYLINASDGKILIQNLSRISRFLRGKKHASSRLYLQYTSRYFSINDINNSARDVVIFDIGANIGEFSIAIAEKINRCRIFAFEPDPVAFECLKYNIDESEITNRITLINMALSNKSGIYPFYVSTKNADSSFIEPKNFTDIIEVQSLRGDEFILANKIASITLIKMDAEGFEPEIIAGFGDQIVNIEFFAIDVGPERYGQETSIEIKNTLESKGITVKINLPIGKRKFLNAYWE